MPIPEAGGETHGWLIASVGAIVAAAGESGRRVFNMAKTVSKLEQQARAGESRLKEHDDKIVLLERNCAQVTANLKTLGDDMDEVKDGVKTLVNLAAGAEVVPRA